MNAPKTANSNTVVIGIGSNHNAEDNITAALDALKETYGALTCSPVYKSAEKTNHSTKEARTYYNLVVSINCTDDIKTCKQHLRKIEDAQGRKRNHKDVSCDLDLLLYGNLCATIEGIQIPHKDIIQCDYVLRPLADLLPEQVHPELKQNFKQLWHQFTQPTTLEPVEFIWEDRLLSIQPACLSL